MVQSGIDQLREQVRGEVIVPDDAGYEQARRVYNAMIDRRPAVVVRCANAGDVTAAVDFAREHQLDVAVRGGQHSVPGFGTCDGGVVVDLSGMRGVRVDPAAKTARVEGGATWGTSMPPPTNSALPPPAGSSLRRVLEGSPSAAVSATWPAGAGCRATTWSRPRS
jgi:hypothetical protein